MASDLPGTGDTRGCETPNMGVMNGTQVFYKLPSKEYQSSIHLNLSQFLPSFSKSDSTSIKLMTY